MIIRKNSLMDNNSRFRPLHCEAVMSALEALVLAGKGLNEFSVLFLNILYDNAEPRVSQNG
jgi:hypothetical protein